MEKLTQQIAMRYPFCSALTCHKWIGEIAGYSKDTMVLNSNDDLPFDVFSYKYSDCQLILKPLSKISDEDIIKIATLYFEGEFYASISNGWKPDFNFTEIIRRNNGIRIKDSKLTISLDITFDISEDFNEPYLWYSNGSSIKPVTAQGSKLITEYLQKTHYDVDNLIEQGIAVEE